MRLARLCSGSKAKHGWFTEASCAAAHMIVPLHPNLEIETSILRAQSITLTFAMLSLLAALRYSPAADSMKPTSYMPIVAD